MKIEYAASYKSIKNLNLIEIPDFTIITGVNGAGKSHFLQALENGSLTIKDNDQTVSNKEIRRFDWSNLIPNESGSFASYQSKQEKFQLWSQFETSLEQSRNRIFAITQTYSELRSFFKIKEIIALDEKTIAGTGIEEEVAKKIIGQIRETTISANNELKQQFINSDPVNRSRLLRGIEASTEMPLVAFDKEDFFENFPASWQPVDMFQQSFSRLFVDYQNKWLSNDYKAYRNTRGDNHKVISDQEFRERFGHPPWEFVNSILDAAKLGFSVDEPSIEDDVAYAAELTDKATGAKIKFNDLSSGERVLMSFALCLYYAKDERQIVEYPKVLLFDEIDAPLHPSMTNSLIKTIEDVLIAQHGIKVILTTHSPSTVALAPENSIYVMKKIGANRLEKSSKDHALSILTSGVPTLSISSENRRQIFVESRHDVAFYDCIYQKLKERLIPEISLNFIACGEGRNGGCDYVKDVVSKLAEAGNRTVFGLIDWDTKNTGTERVFVLGDAERYSIENYLLDPLLVAIMLFLERDISRLDIGLTQEETHINFKDFDCQRLQNAADFVLKKLTSVLDQKQLSVGIDLIECSYLNERSIKLPRWILQMAGHELENKIKEAFPELRKFHSEPQLKLAILKRVFDDLPELLPVGIFRTLKKIQSTQ